MKIMTLAKIAGLNHYFSRRLTQNVNKHVCYLLSVCFLIEVKDLIIRSLALSPTNKSKDHNDWILDHQQEKSFYERC